MAAAAAAGSAPFAVDEETLGAFDKGSSMVEDQLATAVTESRRLKELTASMSEATDSRQEAAIDDKAKASIVAAHKALQTAKALLKQMNERASGLEHGDQAQRAMAQICLPRYRALLQRYMHTTTENQQAKMAFKDASVRRVVSQASLMPEFDGKDEEEIKDMWERDPEVISRAVTRMAHGKVRAEYAMAQQKQQDVRDILRDIEEVATMAKEIADLVELRSEAVDSIVSNINTASDYVKQGNGALGRAMKHQRAARRRMCCFAIIVIVILVIISGSIGGVLGSA